jgi:hypothetical protein
MDDQMPFQLYTVSDKKDPIRISGGMKVVPPGLQTSSFDTGCANRRSGFGESGIGSPHQKLGSENEKER